MKKTNLLMSILGIGALTGTIVPCIVSCGTNTPDDPTETPEMIITSRLILLCLVDQLQ